jgi:hypothetical protein
MTQGGINVKKVVNSNASIYEILKTYPELVELFSKIGFNELTNQSIINTLGRVLTIPTYAKDKSIDMDMISKTFADNNYDLGPR